MNESSANDHHLDNASQRGSRPRMTPPAFGRDCTVGDRLQLRCLWRAIGEYLYARRGARQLETLRSQMLHSDPTLERRELMIRVAMQWETIPRQDAVVLVHTVQETLGEWPSHRECTFRDLAVYLLVSDFLRSRCTTGTQIDMQRVITKWIPI
jgi:hypothetical protein